MMTVSLVDIKFCSSGKLAGRLTASEPESNGLNEAIIYIFRNSLLFETFS